MSKKTIITAYGFDWGTWTRDCAKGVSRVKATRGVHEKFDFGTANLLKKISDALDFIPIGEVNRLNKRIQKWLPKGRFSLELAVTITAGQSQCMGNPPVKIVYAGLTLALTANVELVIDGVKSNASIMLLEHLTVQKEFCRCPVKKAANRRIGMAIPRAEQLIAALQFNLIADQQDSLGDGLQVALSLNASPHDDLEITALATTPSENCNDLT